MSYNEDLGDLWGLQEQQAFENAQARNMEAIESFTVTPTRRGASGGNEKGDPRYEGGLKPCVPSYEWHRYCYGNYMNERLKANGDGESSSSDESDSDEVSEVSVRSRPHEDEDSDDALTQLQEHQRNRRNTNDMSLDESSSSRGKRKASSGVRSNRSNDTSRKRSRNDAPVWMRPPKFDECCMCSFGDEFHDQIEAAEMNELIQINNKCYAASNNMELAMCMVLHFQENIAPKHPDVPPLKLAVALEHIEGLHTLDATLYLGESIRNSKRHEFLLNNKIYREDGTYDRNALADYNKQVWCTTRLYNQKPRNMMFHFDRSKEDQRAGANFMNLVAPMKKQNSQQRQLEHRTAARGLPAFTL